jgi:hypothetical protein
MDAAMMVRAASPMFQYISWTQSSEIPRKKGPTSLAKITDARAGPAQIDAEQFGEHGRVDHGSDASREDD